MGEVNDKICNYIKNNELEIETIMKKYNHYIYTIINNFYGMFSKEDEEEMILDVYLTLWKNLEKLDINKSMSAYIAGVTKNIILKKARKLKSIENIDEYMEQLESIQNIEIDYAESQKNKFIINELDKMRKQDKEVFLAYYYEGRKIKEIAILFGMSESKVKSKLFRTRNKLKKILKKGRYDVNER